MSQPTWNQQQIRQVADHLRRSRASIADIAKEFGLTPSAFTGRVNRHKELQGLLQRRQRPARMSAPRPPSPPRPLPPTVAENFNAAVVPVPLVELHAGLCHFPVDEDSSVVGGFLFCARATGSIVDRYCPKHKARMRQRVSVEDAEQ